MLELEVWLSLEYSTRSKKHLATRRLNTIRRKKQEGNLNQIPIHKLEHFYNTACKVRACTPQCPLSNNWIAVEPAMNRHPTLPLKTTTDMPHPPSPLEGGMGEACCSDRTSSDHQLYAAPIPTIYWSSLPTFVTGLSSASPTSRI